MRARPRTTPAFLCAQGAQFLQIKTLIEPGNTYWLERRLKGVCSLNFLLQSFHKCYSCCVAPKVLGNWLQETGHSIRKREQGN